MLSVYGGQSNALMMPCWIGSYDLFLMSFDALILAHVQINIFMMIYMLKLSEMCRVG